MVCTQMIGNSPSPRTLTTGEFCNLSNGAATVRSEQHIRELHRLFEGERSAVRQTAEFGTDIVGVRAA